MYQPALPMYELHPRCTYPLLAHSGVDSDDRGLLLHCEALQRKLQPPHVQQLMSPEVRRHRRSGSVSQGPLQTAAALSHQRALRAATRIFHSRVMGVDRC